MVSSQIRLLQQRVKFVITPSVADFSSENESCNVIEDTDDFALWNVSFWKGVGFNIFTKSTLQYVKYPREEGSKS